MFLGVHLRVIFFENKNKAPFLNKASAAAILTIPCLLASVVTIPMGMFGGILVSRFKYQMDHELPPELEDDSDDKAIESSTANMLSQMPSAPKNTDSLVVDVPHMPPLISAPKSAPNPEMELRSHYQPS